MLAHVAIILLCVVACRGDAPDAARAPVPAPPSGSGSGSAPAPSAPPPDAALPERPPGAKELATVGAGGVHLFAVAGERIYWTENPPDDADDDRSYRVLKSVSRAGGPAQQLTAPGNLTSIAMIGDDVFVAGYEPTGRKATIRHDGEVNEIDVRKATAIRVGPRA